MRNDFPTAGLLVFIISAILVSSSWCEDDPAEQIHHRMGIDETSFEQILKDPRAFPAITLFGVSSYALEKKRYEDAAYLYYIGAFRLELDTELYPIDEAAEENGALGVVFGSMSLALRTSVNKLITRRPREMEASANRALAWQPAVTENYAPGWTFTKPQDPKPLLANFEQRRRTWYSALESTLKLLNQPAYFEAYQTYLRVVHREEPQPTEAEFQKALATMERIEKQVSGEAKEGGGKGKSGKAEAD